MESVEKFNKLGKSEFVSIFGNIFEKTEWIAEKCYQLKPYNNIDELINLIFSKNLLRSTGKALIINMQSYTILNKGYLGTKIYRFYEQKVQNIIFDISKTFNKTK